MITWRNVPLWWLLVRIKFKLWRYIATRAPLRLVRRVCGGIAPAADKPKQPVPL